MGSGQRMISQRVYRVDVEKMLEGNSVLVHKPLPWARSFRTTWTTWHPACPSQLVWHVKPGSSACFSESEEGTKQRTNHTSVIESRQLSLMSSERTTNDIQNYTQETINAAVLSCVHGLHQPPTCKASCALDSTNFEVRKLRRPKARKIQLESCHHSHDIQKNE